jgi:hypothetical protein
MVSAQPLGFMSRAPLLARAESAPLRDYMLQIEDIHRLERNDVLPIPISPSAIVKYAAIPDCPPEQRTLAEALLAEKPRLVRKIK